MMKKLCKILAMALTLSITGTLFCACAPTETPDPTKSDGSVDDVAKSDGTDSQAAEEKPLRVLFVGNSLTYYNDMPSILQELARLGDHDLTTNSATQASATMCEALSLDEEVGKKLNNAMQEPWDYVVLQPSRRITDKENTVKDAELAAARTIDEMAQAKGGKTLFYITWGNNTGTSTVFKMSADGIHAEKVENYSITQAEHSALLRQICLDYGKALGRDTVDCAAVCEYFITHQTAYEFYHTDKKHPSAIGSFAVACAFYCYLYKESPEAAAEEYFGFMSKADRVLIAQSVAHVILGTEAPEDHLK